MTPEHPVGMSNILCSKLQYEYPPHVCCRLSFEEGCSGKLGVPVKDMQHNATVDLYEAHSDHVAEDAKFIWDVSPKTVPTAVVTLARVTDALHLF